MEETQRCRVIEAHDHFIYSVGALHFHIAIKQRNVRQLFALDFHKKLPFVATGCTDSSVKVWECQ